MTHLLIHLVVELDVCGHVHSRWMYPMEYYMKALKDFVRNKARPEGGMAEGYALEEALAFVYNTWWNFNPHDDGYGMIKRMTKL